MLDRFNCLALKPTCVHITSKETTLDKEFEDWRLLVYEISTIEWLFSPAVFKQRLLALVELICPWTKSPLRTWRVAWQKTNGTKCTKCRATRNCIKTSSTACSHRFTVTMKLSAEFYSSFLVALERRHTRRRHCVATSTAALWAIRAQQSRSSWNKSQISRRELFTHLAKLHQLPVSLRPSFVMRKALTSSLKLALWCWLTTESVALMNL